MDQGLAYKRLYVTMKMIKEMMHTIEGEAIPKCPGGCGNKAQRCNKLCIPCRRKLDKEVATRKVDTQ